MSRVASDAQLEVEAFLYREAGLLEDGRYGEWLDLLTDDVRYVMPVRENMDAASGRVGRVTFSLCDDDKSSLAMRVQRIATGSAHAEVPASVTQRLITNVRVEPGESADELVAQSNFLIYQERLGRFGATFIGKRRDRLRREAGVLRIAERRIELAQRILPTTISIFF